MSIPQNILDEASFLQSQVTANNPLQSAPRANVTAMQLNAAQLVIDTDAALANAATLPVAPVPPGVQPDVTGTLDTWIAPVDAQSIIDGVTASFYAAQNSSDVCLFRGVVGRVASNLDQL